MGKIFISINKGFVCVLIGTDLIIRIHFFRSFCNNEIKVIFAPPNTSTPYVRYGYMKQ